MRTDADKWEQQMRKTLEMEEIPFLESDWDAAKQHIANQPKKDRKIGGIWLWMCIMGVGIVLVWGIGSRYEGLRPFVRQTECVENKEISSPYEGLRPFVRQTESVENNAEEKPKAFVAVKPEANPYEGLRPLIRQTKSVENNLDEKPKAISRTYQPYERSETFVTVETKPSDSEGLYSFVAQSDSLENNSDEKPKTFVGIEHETSRYEGLRPFVRQTDSLENNANEKTKTISAAYQPYERSETFVTVQPKTFVTLKTISPARQTYEQSQAFVTLATKTFVKPVPETLLRFKPREKSFSMSAYAGIAHSFKGNYHASIYGGLAAHYQFHPQWKVQLFAEYQERSAQFNKSNLPNTVQSSPLADSVDITQYNNGSIIASNFVTKTESLFRKQLQYVGVGAGVSYSLHRHSFFANASFLQLIDSRSLKKVTIQDNQSLIYQSNQTLNGFLTGIHPIDITLGLGYNYQISPKWEVNFSTNWGLLDISEDSFYKNAVKNRSFQVRTGISYRLF